MSLHYMEQLNTYKVTTVPYPSFCQDLTNTTLVDDHFQQKPVLVYFGFCGEIIFNLVKKQCSIYMRDYSLNIQMKIFYGHLKLYNVDFHFYRKILGFVIFYIIFYS
jgi:hypothetical protein